ncbi:MAG: phospholipase D-like domain-containing protein [Bacteroidetes bacterium]|nr:phospholipase D-like domain-containing protein [Bacteroidota bacterium]
MEVSGSVKKGKKELVSIRAYKGDAMTLLAFNLDESLLPDCIGFSIHIKSGKKLDYYLLNKLTLSDVIRKKNKISDADKMSSLYSPFQKFNWVHVPSTDHNISTPIFGDYTYSVTPRYLKNGILQPIDAALTVAITIDVSPYKIKGVQIGFARGFISSQAYVRRFGMNNQVRHADGKLQFDIKDKSGAAKRWNDATKKYELQDYTWEEQHKYLGWQARERVMEILDETLADSKMSLDVFAYDLNEPLIVEKLITLAKKGRLRIILDDAGTHGDDGKYEDQFAKLFAKEAKDKKAIVRGHFKSLSHSKIFIQKTNGKANKVLTGSTNFSTNGIYINANHVLIFDNATVAKLYADVFDASFGDALMGDFPQTKFALKDNIIKQTNIPDMTIRFSPHTKAVAEKFFAKISNRITKIDNTDVLFAIMQDTSKSSILTAVKTQVQNEKVFTYGITDSVGKDDSVSLYKPNSTRGLRVAAKGGQVMNVLPPPFDTVPKIDGYAIHHKFVVVNFKGKNPVVYCGSSNLAFNPEQQNGDNLLEIRDRDIVTAFAIEAFRLVEHFHWRNTEDKSAALELDDLNTAKKIWYKKYYNPKDLRCVERILFINPPKQK